MILEDPIPQCPECNSIELYDRGMDIICQNCAMIIDGNIFSNETSGFETGDYSGQMNALTPNLSNSIKVTGYGNFNIKRAINWYSSNYKDKMILEIQEYITNRLRDHFGEVSPEIIIKTCLLFKLLTNYMISRNPIKIGVIAKCYQYICKEYYIYTNNNELKQIFKIDNRILNTANKNINRQIKAQPEVARRLNRIHYDYNEVLKCIRGRMPEITDADVTQIRLVLEYIDRHKFIRINNIESLISGILLILFEESGRKVTHKYIESKLVISVSTINKYYKIMSYYYWAANNNPIQTLE